MDIFDFIEDKHYQYEKALKHKPIKLFEAFAGVGCQAMAFNQLGMPYESVGISEIDKYAIMSYNAIHGKTKNYGDICKMEQIPKCDIFTWSFPCTDLSKAGKQAGLTDTRSGLVYEVIRLLQVTDHKPKVLIMENVVDLVQVKFMAEFYEIQKEIEKLGYTNYTQTLNAKHHGVAQNRNRVFMVSILGNNRYEFPPRIKLEKRLKDYLEESVDEKYWLSQRLINAYTMEGTEKYQRKERFMQNVFRENSDIGNAITTNPGNRPTDNYILFEIKSLCLNSKVGSEQPSLQDRIYDVEGISTAITTSYQPNIAIEVIRYHSKRGILNINDKKYHVRKLTPLECCRLMGITDKDFYKAQEVVSNSQLYKQAGNGIVVDVFAAILKGLIEKGAKDE